MTQGRKKSKSITDDNMDIALAQFRLETEICLGQSRKGTGTDSKNL